MIGVARHRPLDSTLVQAGPHSGAGFVCEDMAGGTGWLEGQCATALLWERMYAGLLGVHSIIEDF